MRVWQDSVRRSMDTSVRESERLQQELEQLTHGVHEKRAETDALKHEWLALRDECTQLRQQRDRYAKYIKCAPLHCSTGSFVVFSERFLRS